MADRDVQIDLLGPFAVRVGAREISVSGFKPRALLATLAMEPGRTVSMDRLGDVLWGDAPASPAVVHTYVRRLLGEHEQALPVAQEAVRVLRELENQRDLAEALMTVGTALTGLGRTGEAIDVLRESVALFGPHSSQQLLAGAHAGLAEALLAAGRRDEALASWREALDIAIRIGDPDVELLRRTIAEHEA